MPLRTVVKDGWVGATTDELSEMFWGLLVLIGVGAAITSGIGALIGYASTPKGRDPTPLALQYSIEAHKNVWKSVGAVVFSVYQAVEDSRPPNPDIPEPPVLPPPTSSPIYR
jgi:hypothetical protein